MMVEPRAESESMTSVWRGPGERIKAARIKADHDLAWAAAHLRLRKSVVEALEANDYDNLPPPVFVQGYLRSYADIVGLPQQEVLQAYRDAMAEKKPEPGHMAAGRTPEKRKSELSNKGKKSVADNSRPKDPPAGVPAAPKAAVETPKPGKPQTAQTKPAKPQTAQAKPAKPVQQEPVAAAVEKRDSKILKTLRDEPRFKPKPPSLPRIKLPPGQVAARWAMRLGLVALAILILSWGISQVSKVRIRSPEAVWQNLQQKWQGLFGNGVKKTVPGPASRLAPPQPVEPPPIRALPEDTALFQPPALTSSLLDPELDSGGAETAPAMDADMAPKKIDMELLGNCWVEIEDSSGEYRLVGELQKGERHRLKGVPPYRVLFGRSKMVKLTVDDEPYDFSRLHQGPVARFSLDP